MARVVLENSLPRFIEVKDITEATHTRAADWEDTVLYPIESIKIKPKEGLHIFINSAWYVDTTKRKTLGNPTITKILHDYDTESIPNSKSFIFYKEVEDETEDVKISLTMEEAFRLKDILGKFGAGQCPIMQVTKFTDTLFNDLDDMFPGSKRKYKICNSQGVEVETLYLKPVG